MTLTHVSSAMSSVRLAMLKIRQDILQGGGTKGPQQQNERQGKIGPKYHLSVHTWNFMQSSGRSLGRNNWRLNWSQESRSNFRGDTGFSSSKDRKMCCEIPFNSKRNAVLYGCCCPLNGASGRRTSVEVNLGIHGPPTETVGTVWVWLRNRNRPSLERNKQYTHLYKVILILSC